LESTVKWTRRALSDLKDIYDYIKKDSPQYAKIQVEKIQKSILKVTNHPKIGRILPEFPELNYREIISGNYRVIYRFDQDKNLILVLLVVHGTRLLNKELMQ
jgi:addiction module RelE/StbE family toxin